MAERGPRPPVALSGGQMGRLRSSVGSTGPALVSAVVVGMFALLILGPLYVWSRLRGAPVEASDHFLQTSPPRPSMTEAWIQQQLAEHGPCPHGIEVVTLSDWLDNNRGGSASLPEWVSYPDTVVVYADGLDEALKIGTVDVGGTLALDGLPCQLGGGVEATVAERIEVGRESIFPLEKGWTGDQPLIVAPLARLPVQVVNAADGTPVPGAVVVQNHGRNGYTADDAGRVVLEMPVVDSSSMTDAAPIRARTWSSFLEVYAEGFQVGSLRLDAADIVTANPERRVVALEPGHLVGVSCQNAPGVQCPRELMCAASWSLEGSACQRMPELLKRGDERDLLCSCPRSEAVLRGIGRSLAVPPDVDHVSIDLADQGMVYGTLDEDVSRCSVEAQRLVNALEDVGHIGPLGTVPGRCDPTSETWAVAGLGHGDWLVTVEVEHAVPRNTSPVSDSDVRPAVAIAVPSLFPDEHRDLGTVATRSGSRLTVSCVDPTTGKPSRERDTVFVQHQDPELAVGYAWPLTCGDSIYPALPGEWRVWRLPWVHHNTTVTLAPGEELEVTFETEESEAVEVLGAVIEPHKRGLLVKALDPASPLAEAGLGRGDVIVALQAMGVPVPMADKLTVTAGVLGIWGTSGIELFVVPHRKRTGHWVVLEQDG